MSLSKLQIWQIEEGMKKFLEKHRPSTDIRAEVDIDYRVSKQSLEIFEVRPDEYNPGAKTEFAYAKTTYVKTQKTWKIYWMRADLKWHSYTPVPEVSSVEEFINVVSEDEHGCFFG